jgi:hypothetical protein
MSPRKSIGGPYPKGWASIAAQIKAAAGWKCIRCGHKNEFGHVLTVHHLDMDPANCAWWNLVALCQQCHLHIQAKVILDRPYMFDHSDWFKPYVAGYYAHCQALPEDRPFVDEHIDELLDYGRPPTETMLSW